MYVSKKRHCRPHYMHSDTSMPSPSCLLTLERVRESVRARSRSLPLAQSVCVSTQTLRHKRTLSPSLLLSLHVSSCLIPPNPAPGLILQPRFVTKNEQISLSLSLFPSISLSRSSIPIRNPCELRGLCRHSYFGPRTFGGGITNVIEVSGLSIRVSPSHP